MPNHFHTFGDMRESCLEHEAEHSHTTQHPVVYIWRIDSHTMVHNHLTSFSLSLILYETPMLNLLPFYKKGLNETHTVD